MELKLSPKLIPLRGHGGVVHAYAMVDHEDYKAVSRYRWHLDRVVDGYATRRVSNPSRTRPRQLAIPMHRELLGLAYGDPRQGDHISGDRLDNRRCNLRIVADQSEQMQNIPAHRDGSASHRGVSFFKPTQRWKAYIHLGGKQIHLGYYASESEAAAVALEARRAHMPFAVER